MTTNPNQPAINLKLVFDICEIFGNLRAPSDHLRRTLQLRKYYTFDSKKLAGIRILLGDIFGTYRLVFGIFSWHSRDENKQLFESIWGCLGGNLQFPSSSAIFGNLNSPFQGWKHINITYCKIPIISPGLIFVQKAVLLGVFSVELIFGGACYWKEFCVSKWVGLVNKNSLKHYENSLKHYENSLKQLKTANTNSPWAYFREGLFLEGLVIGILRYSFDSEETWSTRYNLNCRSVPRNL